MIDDPKRTYKELKEIYKVYEAYLYILNRYTFGIKDVTLKDSLAKHFEGDSWDEINIAIKVAMNEYDPFLYQLHNAILDYEKSNEEYFNCQKYSEQLSGVMDKCNKDIDRVRQEEIHDKLTAPEPQKQSRGQNKQIEMERKKKECYALYDELIKTESKDTDALRKAKIAKKIGRSTKSINRYLQARDWTN